MPSAHMTGTTPANRDTVSRSKACRTLTARQERKLKDKEWKFQVFKHRNFYTEKCLHRGALTHRRCDTAKFLHRGVFPHRNFYTQKFLHREVFTRRVFYTGVCTRRSFNTEKLYMEELLHTEVVRKRHVWCSKIVILDRKRSKSVKVQFCSSLGNPLRRSRVLDAQRCVEMRIFCGRALPFRMAWRPNAKNRCRIAVLKVQMQHFRTKWRSKGKKLV